MTLFCASSTPKNETGLPRGKPVSFLAVHKIRRIRKIRANPWFRHYLFDPALIMAQRKPMVDVEESSAMKRRVPGESQ